MAVERKTIRFGKETWAKGTRGLESPYHSERPSLVNGRLLPSGELMSAPHYPTTVTTLATKFSRYTKLWPAAYNYGYASAPTKFGFVAVEGTDIEFFEYGTSTAYAQGGGAVNYGNTKASWLSQIDDTNWLLDEFWIDLQGPAPATPKQIQEINCATALTTAFTTPNTFQCRGSAIHQGRAFFWGHTLTGTDYSDSNRIYFSDAYAYNTFTTTTGKGKQYFDIDGRVEGCISVNNVLLIWTTGGEWWTLNGRGDPSLATLTSVGHSRIPDEYDHPVVLDNRAIFMSKDQTAVCTVDSSGVVDDTSMAYLGNTGEPTAASAEGRQSYASSINNVFVLNKSNPYKMMINGVWTQESWPFTDYTGTFQTWIDDYYNKQYVAEFNTTASAWKVYGREIYEEDPSLTGSGSWLTYSTTLPFNVTLPRLFDPTRQVRVRRVIVDGKTWGLASVGDYENPRLQVSISRESAAGYSDLWNQGPAGLVLTTPRSGEGAEFRAVYMPDDMESFAPFVDVWLTGVRSIGIQAVTVELEISDMEIVQ